MKKFFIKTLLLLSMLVLHTNLFASALSSPSEPAAKRAKEDPSPKDTLITVDHGITQSLHTAKEKEFSREWLAIEKKDLHFVKEYFDKKSGIPQHPLEKEMYIQNENAREYPLTPLDLVCKKVQTKTDPYAHLIAAFLYFGGELSTSQTNSLITKKLFPLYPWDLIEEPQNDHPK